ncbi:MAG: hypothetical protein PHW82_00650 [Bacteroidales bacterium]|nr:hypothetical protein [Bacteroidales bacterium]
MKKIELLVLSLSFLFVFFACDNIENKNKKEESKTDQQQSKLEETELADETFLEFYEEFVADENFQLERVKFPVVGSKVLDYEEQEEWTSENWEMLLDVNEVDQNVFTVEIVEDENRIEHTIYIPNSGFGVYYAFELIGGKWYLTERTDTNL